MLLLKLAIYFFISICEAKDIVIEIGQRYQIKSPTLKIWVENKKIAVIERKKPHFYIKALRVGITHFRIDNELYKFVVMPLNSQKALERWKKLKNNFVNIEIKRCDEFICLEGNLYRIEDYIKIININRSIGSIILLSLQVSPSIQDQLNLLLQQKIAQDGLPPVKILTNGQWKIFLPPLKNQNELAKKIIALGINPIFSEKAVGLNNNIKVSVKIVELNKNSERKLGLRWPQNQQLQFSNLNNLKDFETVLIAAERHGEAKILASPNLICSNGKEASFFAGGEFPIQVLGLRSKEIQWKRYGVGLNLKPLVDSYGQMSLQLDTEVSTLDRSMTVEDIPAIHTNRVSTYVDLKDKLTIAISGLIKNEVSQNEEGLPYLMQLPILGSLFKSKNFQENKSELIIFVTPELMN